MDWTDEQLDRLRDRIALAKRQGLWVSADEGGIVLGLIRFWRRSTRLAGHDGAAKGPLPTIAHARSHGITGVHVTCRRVGCGNRRRLSFADVGLSESVAFVEIGRRRRFRCHRCGSRDVLVSADWPEYRPPR